MTEAAAGHTIVDPVGGADAVAVTGSAAPGRSWRSSPFLMLAGGVAVGLVGFAGTFVLGRATTATPAQGKQIRLTTPSGRVVPIVAPGLAGGVPALVKAAPKVTAVAPVTPVTQAPARQQVYVAPTPRPTVTVVAKPAAKPAAKPQPSTQHTTTYYTTTFG